MRRALTGLLVALFCCGTFSAAFAVSTWKEQVSPSANIIQAIDFAGTSNGFAATAHGNILKTFNGGVTWETAVSFGADKDLYGIDMTDSSNGFAAGSSEAGGSGQVYRTANGWSTVPLPDLSTGNAQMNDVSFVNSLEGWACGSLIGSVPVKVFHTTNGTTWNTANVGLSPANFYGIHAVNNSNIWIVGATGGAYTIYKWSTTGSVWEGKVSPVSVTLKDVYFIDTSFGWAVGDNKVLRTSNGGTSWAQATVTTAVSGRSGAVSLEAVHFYDADNGLVVGRVGSASYIARTTNGGVSWTEDASYITSVPLYDVRALNSTTAIAVGGNSGLVVRYSANPVISAITLDGRSSRPVGYTGGISIEVANLTTASTVSASGISLSNVTVDTNLGRITAIATTTASGVSTITVYNPDGGTTTGTYQVNPLPIISACEPVTMTQGQTGDVAITGTGFQSTLTAAFSLGSITLNSLTYNSSTHLTANVTIAGSGATGVSDITLTNPDGGIVANHGVFSVSPLGVTPPSVEACTPSSALQGETLEVTVTGSNFHANPTVVFGNGDIIVNTVSRLDSSTLKVNISLSPTSPTRYRTLTVINSDDSGVGSLSNAFRVVSASAVNPIISTVIQNALYPKTGQAIFITGTGFLPNPAVTFSPAENIIVNDVEYLDSAHLRVWLDIDTSAVAGARELLITNGDGGQATLSGGLTILAQSAPGAISKNSLPVRVFPYVVNPLITPTVNLQFVWPGAADVIKLIPVASDGQGAAPLQANVTPGLNNLPFNCEHLANGLVPVNIIYRNQVIGKAKIAVLR